MPLLILLVMIPFVIVFTIMGVKLRMLLSKIVRRLKHIDEEAWKDLKGMWGVNAAKVKKYIKNTEVHDSALKDHIHEYKKLSQLFYVPLIFCTVVFIIAFVSFLLFFGINRIV